MCTKPPPTILMKAKNKRYEVVNLSIAPEIGMILLENLSIIKNGNTIKPSVLNAPRIDVESR